MIPDSESSRPVFIALGASAFVTYILLSIWGIQGNNDYKKMAIYAPIKKIPSYSRGWPHIVLADGRDILLMINGSGQEYVQVGDSIIKKAGEDDTVIVYRRHPSFYEVSVFAAGGNLGFQYSSLVARYRKPVLSQ